MPYSERDEIILIIKSGRLKRNIGTLVLIISKERNAEFVIQRILTKIKSTRSADSALVSRRTEIVL